jgi:hypothetical protein
MKKNMNRVLPFVLLVGLAAARPAGVELGWQNEKQPAVDLAQTSVNTCCAEYLKCPLPAPQPAGTPCVCEGPSGSISGYAC